MTFGSGSSCIQYALNQVAGYDVCGECALLEDVAEKGGELYEVPTLPQICVFMICVFMMSSIGGVIYATKSQIFEHKSQILSICVFVICVIV